MACGDVVGVLREMMEPDSELHRSHSGFGAVSDHLDGVEEMLALRQQTLKTFRLGEIANRHALGQRFPLASLGLPFVEFALEIGDRLMQFRFLRQIAVRRFGLQRAF